MNKHTTHNISQESQAVYSSRSVAETLSKQSASNGHSSHSDHSSHSVKKSPSPTYTSMPHAPCSKPPSKHKRRRDRREQYYEMIDSSLPEERHFAGRIIDTVNRGGMDIAHDGRPIKSFWRHYLKTRDLGRNANARACLYLLDKTFRSVRPKVYL